MKLLLLSALLVGSSFASSITGTVNLACSISGVAVPCPTTIGGTTANATGSYNFSGLNTPTLFLSAHADAGAGSVPPPGLSPSASAAVFLTVDAFTDGPMRPGLVTISLFATEDHSFSGGAAATSHSSIDVSIPSVATSCTPLGISDCQSHGTLLPIMLGVPFQLRVSAEAAAGGNLSFAAGSSAAFLNLALFELSGDPVTIWVTPEPSSGSMMAGALLIALLGRFTPFRLGQCATKSQRDFGAWPLWSPRPREAR